eukprot:CAMPEP_0178914912 /NCGR_PEP_ID=MMETSP0786-20121207/11710_1 /TAXON_ID=186022 /ORGANISM="Thalassionema frauenfeldii, Strain CCMP 1798" /LENGTH=400 /DNA_ID=CAMNT_0020587915 /DNA_START=170 /DNA_END=1369 /DNA_ORIENTATION=-
MSHFQSRRDSLGCDAVCIGSMTSARSGLTLVGATLIGKLSDTRRFDRFGGGRKLCLMIGIMASLVELVLSSHATSIRTLWISMVPSALLNQNFTIMKALFGDYHNNLDGNSSAAERAGSVGKLGMAVGLAFMVGPLASSTFFTTYEQAAIFAAICLLASLAFVFLLPHPQSTSQQQQKNRTTTNQEAEKEKLSSSIFQRFLPDFVPAARTPAALFLMTCRVCMALAFHIFQTIWSVALRQRFEFGPKEYGFYFSFIGFAYAMSQGFVAKFLIQKFGSSNMGRCRLLLWSSLILGGGRMIAYTTNHLAVVYGIFGLIITALGVVNTIFTADTSKIASPQELGGLFGVLSSVESLAGIAGPILGGTLTKMHPQYGPLGVVVVLYGIVFSSVYLGYERYVGGV